MVTEQPMFLGVDKRANTISASAAGNPYINNSNAFDDHGG